LSPGAAAGFQKRAAPRIEVGYASALYVGPPLGIGFHRGAVSCFALALAGSLELTLAAPPRATGAVGSALIAAGARHRVEIDGGEAAFLYLEPTGGLAAAFQSQMSPVHPHAHVGYPAEETLRAAFKAGRGLEVLQVQQAPMDARIRRVVHALGAGGLLAASAAEVAAAVRLSPSQFMRLFRAGVGVPFRRYRLWARFRAAIRGFTDGGSWTEAAHAAGFASSSHFSDAFRAMFGARPSLLAAASIRLSAGGC
jgi:AraC-like DNA-binding protein